MKLCIAKCCGSCLYVNKPKLPTDHAPYYSISKTERWCFKNNVPTMREAICEDYLFDNKGTVKRNFGRIKGQNERLDKLKEISEFFIAHKIPLMKTNYRTYLVHDNRLCYRYEDEFLRKDIRKISCKDSLHKELLEAYEKLKMELHA